MYLHIGHDVIVPFKEVIAIIDYDTINRAQNSREFLQVAELEGVLEKSIFDKEIKSCVITEKKVYLSSISPATLWRRSKK